MQSVKQILKNFNPTQDKYISREFQSYGYSLAEELGDLAHKALYIKLAKVTPRVILDEAKSFIKDAGHVKSKPKLFMWKLKTLRQELEAKRQNAQK